MNIIASTGPDLTGIIEDIEKKLKAHEQKQNQKNSSNHGNFTNIISTDEAGSSPLPTEEELEQGVVKLYRY